MQQLVSGSVICVEMRTWSDDPSKGLLYGCCCCVAAIAIEMKKRRNHGDDDFVAMANVAVCDDLATWIGETRANACDRDCAMAIVCETGIVCETTNVCVTPIVCETAIVCDHDCAIGIDDALGGYWANGCVASPIVARMVIVSDRLIYAWPPFWA